mgnify:CR=1 FL=1
MEAKAILRYARISPRKVKIVLDLIRGKDAGTAMAILKNTNKAASELLITKGSSVPEHGLNSFSMHGLVKGPAGLTMSSPLFRAPISATVSPYFLIALLWTFI